MWQNIPWHIIKYFAMSLENCHVENEYTKNIPWHGMEYCQRFYLAQAHLLGLFKLEWGEWKWKLNTKTRITNLNKLSCWPLSVKLKPKLSTELCHTIEFFLLLV